jgi:hypothetical protein
MSLEQEPKKQPMSESELAEKSLGLMTDYIDAFKRASDVKSKIVCGYFQDSKDRKIKFSRNNVDWEFTYDQEPGFCGTSLCRDLLVTKRVKDSEGGVVTTQLLKIEIDENKTFTPSMTWYMENGVACKKEEAIEKGTEMLISFQSSDPDHTR